MIVYLLISVAVPAIRRVKTLVAGLFMPIRICVYIVWRMVDTVHPLCGELDRTLTCYVAIEKATLFMHDGSQSSLRGAIDAHGGEAQAAKDRFDGLGSNQKNSIVDFLMSL